MRRSPVIAALVPALLAGALPVMCALIAIGFALFAVPAGGAARFSRGSLLLYGVLLLLVSLPALLVPLLALRRRGGVQLEILAAGLEPGDYALIQRLFPSSVEVRLQPLDGGYSGAAVLRAQSWGEGATLQRSSVVKVGPTAKLQQEEENFERYVREYVGNTATLLSSAQRGGRMSLRWAYASFIGEQVRTLAEYAASGAPLPVVLDELFASRSTLGLLLGTARRDPQYALYRENSWPLRDWQRILDATSGILGGDPLRADLPFAAGEANPLPTVVRWCDPHTGTGERADLRFDVPIATIHGDLNSRNILIDERGSIFVIDFAQAGPGQLLRDFARLEVELLLVVGQPVDDVEALERVRDAETLLAAEAYAQRGRVQTLLIMEAHPPATLRDLLAPRSAVAGARIEAIVTLRRQAHDLAGPWLNAPAAIYLLPLLHATLDTLRYVQCDPPTRRAALLIAARLCRLLA